MAIVVEVLFLAGILVVCMNPAILFVLPDTTRRSQWLAFHYHDTEKLRAEFDRHCIE